MKTLKQYLVMLLGALLVLAILVMLFGCTAKMGRVTDKKFHAAYASSSSDCYRYNTQGFCIQRQTKVTYYPQRFCFKLDDNWLETCVPENMWNKYKIGDYFPGVGRG